MWLFSKNWDEQQWQFNAYGDREALNKLQSFICFKRIPIILSALYYHEIVSKSLSFNYAVKRPFFYVYVFKKKRKEKRDANVFFIFTLCSRRKGWNIFFSLKALLGFFSKKKKKSIILTYCHGQILVRFFFLLKYNLFIECKGVWILDFYSYQLIISELIKREKERERETTLEIPFDHFTVPKKKERQGQ